MYVCLCNGITDRAIRCAIKEQGINTLCGLAEKLSVGTQCGCCCEAAQALIEETTQSQGGFMPTNRNLCSDDGLAQSIA